MNALLLGPSQREGSLLIDLSYIAKAIFFGRTLTLSPTCPASVIYGQRTMADLITVCRMLLSGLLIDLHAVRESSLHAFAPLAVVSSNLDRQYLSSATLSMLAASQMTSLSTPGCLAVTFASPCGRVVEHGLWAGFGVLFMLAYVHGQKRRKVAAQHDADQVYLDHHDALTGLRNRLLLERHTENAIIARASYIFMAVYLDRSRIADDSIGNRVHDELLILAAKRMMAEVVDVNQLIRMGNDNFSLSLTQCSDIAVAEDIAVRFIHALKQPFQYSGRSVCISVSISICQNIDALMPTGQIVRNSGLALRRAKKSGRDCYVVCSGGLRVEMPQELSLENRLRGAILSKSLQVHYQPIVDTDGTVLAFEALLRWDDAVHGIVSPEVFIPVAERCGLIVTLGTWVLREALAQGADWRKAGNKAVKVAVNVSATQLASVGFAATVLSALEEFDVPPEMLDLELTESAQIQDHSQTLRAMNVLNRLGVRLSIDDFGTGYSSLSYLRDLPVHTIKIDRTFVKDIVHREESRLLIAGMINMAHTLRLRVVAEGVESREQLEVLAQVGCDEIQGFLISQAISSEQAQKFMDSMGAEQWKKKLASNILEMPSKLANAKQLQ